MWKMLNQCAGRRVWCGACVSAVYRANGGNPKEGTFAFTSTWLFIFLSLPLSFIYTDCTD